MTVLDATAPPATEPRPQRKPKRRWHRVAIPFSVVLALVVATLVFHALNEPDVEDPAFLSPASTAAIGSSVLADRLTTRGIRVERHTRTSDALLSAYRGSATLVVPAPALMHTDYLQMLWAMPLTTRVVLIEPAAADLTRADAPMLASSRRWAAAAVVPGTNGCDIAGLRSAGNAAVLRTTYGIAPGSKALNQRFCYSGGVVRVRWRNGEVIAVGAADPFRNDRIDEHGNAEFALGLLAEQPRVVWLDVHEREPGPQVDPNASPGADGVPPSLAPGGSGDGSGDGSGSGDGNGGTGGHGSGGASGEPTGGSSESDGGTQAAGPEPPSLFDALPDWFWAMLLGALVLGLLLALYAARRLGPPIPEPLPFTVRGAETVLGRARLYQRAGAMLSGAQTLRRATGPQIAVALGLPPTAEAAELAAAIAARHGGDPAEYLAVLADDLPKKDVDLVALTARLDALLTMVSTPPQGETRG
jgi:uncharacterized membrane protein YgcG